MKLMKSQLMLRNVDFVLLAPCVFSPPFHVASAPFSSASFPFGAILLFRLLSSAFLSPPPLASSTIPSLLPPSRVPFLLPPTASVAFPESWVLSFSQASEIDFVWRSATALEELGQP
ncbi:hypothetical protein JOM56_002523 [Amanita muscaria]